MKNHPTCSWLLEGIDKSKALVKYQKNISQARINYAKIKNPPTIEKLFDHALPQTSPQKKLKPTFFNWRQSFFFHPKNESHPKDSAITTKISPDSGSTHLFISSIDRSELQREPAQIFTNTSQEQRSSNETMTGNPSEIQQTPQQKCSDSKTLAQFISSQEPQAWLKNLMAFIYEGGLAFCQNELKKTKTLELECIYNSFLNPENITVINNLFYFKSHPEDLQEKSLDPEKCISLQTRLSSLYACIEEVQQQVIKLLEERGFNDLKDYLFHGASLPAEVYIKPQPQFKALIIETSKNFYFKEPPLRKKNKPYLDSLITIYRHAFQPKKLIDMIVNLKIKLIGIKSLSQQEYLFLKEKFLSLQQQLTTDQCIDLYGYFSSKESFKFLKILDLIAKGKEIKGLEKLNQPERKAVQQVSLYLTALTEALKESLRQRQILTQEPTEVEVKTETLNFEIEEALQRILLFF